MQGENNVHNDDTFALVGGVVRGVLYSYFIWVLHYIVIILYLLKLILNYSIIQYAAPIAAGIIVTVLVVDCLICLPALISEKSWGFVIMETLFSLRYGICPVILLIIDCFI